MSNYPTVKSTGYSSTLNRIYAKYYTAKELYTHALRLIRIARRDESQEVIDIYLDEFAELEKDYPAIAAAAEKTIAAIDCPFAIGDLVEADGKRGYVQSTDSYSTIGMIAVIAFLCL